MEKLTFVELTGTAPQPHDGGSTAGLTHEWDVRTKYYNAKVPIWIDEIPDVEAWKTEFVKPEAKEVVEAVGAWMYCFRTPTGSGEREQIDSTMKAIQEISEEHGSYGGDALMLAVALPSSTSTAGKERMDQEEWEDMCLPYGFEYVDFSAHGTNEFGEEVGFERLKEALEANEWADDGASDSELNLEDLNLNAEDDGNDFSRDEAEMTAEIFGMKAALAGDDFEPEGTDFLNPKQQENQVDDLDRLMSRLLAVKESSAGLPEDQRRKMAAKAVSELLKDSSL